MRGIVVVGLLFAAGCSSNNTPPAGPTPAEIDKRVKEEVATAVAEERKRWEAEAKKQPAPAEIPPAVPPMPPAKRFATFTEAWAEVLALSKDLDAKEPAKTAEAIQGLGLDDRKLAQSITARIRQGIYSQNEEQHAMTFGLRDLLSRGYRVKALKDEEGFKNTAARTWNASVKPSDYLKALDAWGSSDRNTTVDASNAVGRGGRPFKTEAVRLIEAMPGGDEYLKQPQR